MRKLLLAIAGLSLFSTPFAQISVIASKSGLSLEEAAGAYLLAKALNIDATFIISTGRNYGVPIYTLGPAFVICRDSHRRIDEVMSLRKRGMGWGVIAHRLGVPPQSFHNPHYKMEKMPDSVFMDASWRPILVSRGCSQTEIVSLQRRGYSYQQIVAGTAFASELKRSPREVFTKYEKSKSWKKAHSELSSRSSKVASTNNNSTKGKGNGGNKGKGKGHGGG